MTAVTSAPTAAAASATTATTATPTPAEAAADALNCHDVHKRFAARPALAGVSLRVRRGEFVALLGPNGAGKTTLFQILTGLFVQDQGQVTVMGADMRATPVRALAHIGIVFQHPAIDLDLSVEANLRFHADLHGLSRQESNARMAPLLAHLGLAGQRRTPVRELSGGNRRKVELIRALLHQPDLLLMDEATVGLDPGARMQIVTEARRLATHNRVGILWATHLVAEVEASDRVVVLHRGLVRFDGTPADLLRATGDASLEAAFLSLTGTPAQEH